MNDTGPLPSVLRWPGWPAAASTTAALATFVALQRWAHWPGLAVTGAVIGALIAVRAVTDMWPRRVPPPLARDVANLAAQGWRPSRYHPFLCTEKKQHVHLVSPKPRVNMLFTYVPPPEGK